MPCSPWPKTRQFGAPALTDSKGMSPGSVAKCGTMNTMIKLDEDEQNVTSATLFIVLID